MRDLYNNVSVESALDVQAIASSTTTVGNIVDLQGKDSVLYTLKAGTITDGTYTPVLEYGNDSGLSDAATVSSDHLLGTIAGATFAATDDDTVKTVGLRAHVGYRYARLSITSTGVTTGVDAFSADVVTGNLINS